MMRSIAASMAQGTVYSLLVGATYKTVVDRDWDVTKLPAFSAFWAGFVVPSGIGWSLLNNRALKALSLPKDPIGLIKNFNGKFIAADIFLNHILYQIFIVTSMNFFLGALNYDKTRAQTKKDPKTAYKEMANHLQNIQKDLIFKRLQITAISYLIDIFASRYMRGYHTGSKFVFLKTNILNFYWHQYLIYKIESNPAFKLDATPEEVNAKP